MVKKIILLTTILISNIVNADNVYITNGYSTTIVVNGKILKYKTGKDSFKISKYYNSLTIDIGDKGLKEVNTNLLVSYITPSKEVKHRNLMLQYRPNFVDTINNFFYDYKKEELEELAKKNVKKKTQEEIERALVIERLKKIRRYEDKITDIGVKGDLDLYLTNMMMDETNLYLKFKLENKSGIDYNINYLSFQYINLISKGFFMFWKEPEKQSIDVDPVYITQKMRIKPNEESYLVFSIPSYGLKNQDYLEIILREKRGTRDINFKITGTQIKEAEWF